MADADPDVLEIKTWLKKLKRDVQSFYKEMKQRKRDLLKSVEMSVKLLEQMHSVETQKKAALCQENASISEKLAQAESNSQRLSQLNAHLQGRVNSLCTEVSHLLPELQRMRLVTSDPQLTNHSEGTKNLLQSRYQNECDELRAEVAMLRRQEASAATALVKQRCEFAYIDTAGSSRQPEDAQFISDHLERGLNALSISSQGTSPPNVLNARNSPLPLFLTCPNCSTPSVKPCSSNYTEQLETVKKTWKEKRRDLYQSKIKERRTKCMSRKKHQKLKSPTPKLTDEEQRDKRREKKKRKRAKERHLKRLSKLQTELQDAEIS